MRRVLPFFALALILVSTAAAATVRGTARNDLLQTAFGGNDKVTCGRGVDVVSADATDKVAADCEFVSRRLSVDIYGNRDSQHESAVEPDSFAYGSTVVAAFQVGRRAGGASSNIGTAVSHDAGRTWQRSYLPGITENAGGSETAASDPSVAFDALHNTWLVSSLTIHRGGSNVFISRSTDGLHWSGPVNAAEGPVLDKEWLACDNGASSQFHGRCYVEYTDDQKNITVSETSDDGGQTWSAPVPAANVLVGTQPVVLPNGTLVVVAGDYHGEEALQGAIVAVRSTNGGATFQRFTVSDLQSATDDPMRAIALPSVDVDSNGTIYAAWHDCRFRPGCHQNDIVISTSTDGATWTPAARVAAVPTGSNESDFIPGLGADPATPGHLALVFARFQAGSCAKGACTLGIAFTQSLDGGRSWAKPQRLDALPIKMSWLPRAEGGRMVGDYFSTSFVGGRVIPIYALAAPPLANGRLREGIFAASLKQLGQRR